MTLENMSRGEGNNRQWLARPAASMRIYLLQTTTSYDPDRWTYSPFLPVPKERRALLGHGILQIDGCVVAI